MFSMSKFMGNDWRLKLIMFVFPIIFLIIGAFSIYDTNRKLNSCTNETFATITGIRENDGAYALDYTYEYNGQTYNHEDNMYSSDNRKYHEGDTISILINPNKPKEQIFDTKTPTVFGKIFVLAGIGIYGLYGFIDIIDLVSKKKEV